METAAAKRSEEFTEELIQKYSNGDTTHITNTKTPEQQKKKRKLRRTTQRQQKKAKQKEERVLDLSWYSERQDNQFNMIIDATKNYCMRKFGFISLHNEQYLNVRQALSETPVSKFCYKMENCTFHDLTTIITPPPNLHLSLGLGQKFIIQKPLPNLNFTPTMERLRRDIKVKFFYAGEEGLQNHPFNQNNYIPSSWIPPLAHPDIEEMMSDFQAIVEKEKQKIKHEKHSNLSKAQQDSLNALMRNPNLIVALADKGLGPVVLERDTYDTRVFKDHLNDKKNI